ncbi:MAG: cold shock domain-containing protein [Paracoccus sp. (in: a-proteobacteria)]|nr:cold shock domain-containing protein [Paracoccus sp. (in: a-proteobacteria)]
MMVEEQPERFRAEGFVKWFDPGKGFGFVVNDGEGPDILLHVNVLRNFGQSTIADQSWVSVEVQRTPRGLQASEVLEIRPPETGSTAPIADLVDTDLDDLSRLPMLPARVKWFDKAKGFGFANIFGRSGDVFLHIEVLRHCGFADLVVGEAVALQVVDGRRGLMAARIYPWDRATAPDEQGAEGDAMARHVMAGL